MICVVIKGPTYHEAALQVQKALEVGHLVELRLDYFQTVEITELRKLQSLFSAPMIFTLRSTSEGGLFSGSDAQQIKILEQLATLQPAFIDIEARLKKHEISRLAALYPNITWIVSAHGYDVDLSDFMQIPNALFKVAKIIDSSTASLEFLELSQKYQGRGVFIGMGSYGLPTRILAPVFQSPFTYAALSEKERVVPEQPIAEELQSRYKLSTLNSETKVFGLLGFPVSTSISDWTHNQLMQILDLKSVYVKFPVRKEELELFLKKSKKLNFKGLSVTMPLKETILPYLDQIDETTKEIGAANTLLFEDGAIKGSNTDGEGALKTIERYMSCKNLAITIIGAGGVARAIAYEASRKGARVTVLSRKPETTAGAFQRLGCCTDSLSAIQHYPYDLLINATPDPCPLKQDFIIPEKVVMDLKSRPKETLLIQLAKKKRCKVIYGFEMFVEQAALQFSTWFSSQANRSLYRDILLRQALTLFK